MRTTRVAVLATVTLPLLAILVGSSALTGPLRPAGGPAHAAAQGDPGCTSTVQGEAGTWTRRQVPAFPAGPQRIVSHAVDPHAPERALLTNGVSLLRTADGCRWSEVWRVPSAPTAGLPFAAGDRLLELHVHPRQGARAWAVVAVGGEAADLAARDVPLSPADGEARDPSSAVVLHSEDHGRTWQASEDPPLPGTPGPIASSPLTPDLLWLPTAAGLHSSRDGGASWQLLPAALTTPVEGRRPLDGVTSPLLQRVTASPDDGRILLGRTTTPVRSTDGGLTWRAHPTPAGHWSGPFAATSPGGEARFARQDDSTSPVEELHGGDADLTATPVTGMAGVPWRGAWHPSGGELLVATGDRGNGASFPDVSLYRVTAGGDVTDVDDLGLPAVLGVLADDAGGYHLHTATELVSLLPDEVAAPAGQVDLSPFPPTTPAPPEPVRLGAPASLVLRPGERAGVTVQAVVPRRPRPLDTYFLLDTSNSFDRDIQAVADSMGDVVRRLRSAGVDAWFGVGELGTQEARRYHRHADLAPPGTGLVRGFESLRTGGGVESHLIALHQAATGSGVEGTVGPDVPPGQDPTWRPGALRTLLVVTDVQYSDEDDPDAPTRASTYTALADAGVRVLALEVVREGGDDGVPGSYAAVEAADAAGRTVPTPARRDLEELARATGSFAPPGGVDCRGNGTVEVPEGAPLVCTTTQLHLAGRTTLGAVLQRVLLAQQDLAPIRLDVSTAVRVRRTPAWAARLDLRRDHRLTFPTSLSCRRDQAGEVHPAHWRLSVAGRVVAARTTRVQCGRLPAGTTPTAGTTAAPFPGPAGTGLQPAPQPVPGAGPAQAGVVPLAPPPPAPVTSTGTSPSTSSSPAGSPAGSPASDTAPASTPVAAAAHEREAELELAPLTVLAGAAFTAAAAALQRRRTPRPARSTRSTR